MSEPDQYAEEAAWLDKNTPKAIPDTLNALLLNVSQEIADAAEQGPGAQAPRRHLGLS